jgi:A/G-specific adenine glycosylase
MAWFDAHRRELPWREDRDPYRVWISEVMLQQTTVAAVIPRFERFLQRFPTLQALAAAEESEVLLEWEGLGYYSRARNLHRGARQIVERHGGQFPSDRESIAALPGVGPYILGAILSQAFEVRAPIVEANTKRLYCRLFGQAGDITSKPVTDWMWQVAEEILPKTRVGDFNQALMEVGALICTPTNPACGECPFRSKCLAYRDGMQDRIPRKPAAKKPTAVREVSLVVRNGPRILLMVRPAGGRWENMWECPKTECADGESLDEAAARLAETLGLSGTPGRIVTTVNYTITRFRIAMTCLEFRVTRKRFRPGEYQEGRWLTLSELGEYPVSTPQRQLLAALVCD